MKTAEQILDILLEKGIRSYEEVACALRDGEALAALGITDEDQDAVEELHSQNALLAGL